MTDKCEFCGKVIKDVDNKAFWLYNKAYHLDCIPAVVRRERRENDRE